MTLDLGADSYFSMLRGYSTEKANQRFEVEVAKSANDGEEPQYQKVGTVVSGEADGLADFQRKISKMPILILLPMIRTAISV